MNQEIIKLDENLINNPIIKIKVDPSLKKVYNKKYYTKHREERIKHCIEKVTCICGRSVNRAGLALHNRTKIHLKRIIKI